ncbi:S9 family peptidase [Pseudoalteromonas luteoviolacea]|uniref:Peptidase S9 prolyl oligopeptidase catalytic domain-containing protein n=1 Tax=Pseudoalteromonas luteoviolacea S4054 TaxID=1129367 RepID=A0A0F6A8H7_9GAMM|nr:S9 family peptidase [Pseudoalteromonas luteoviolacea]AOT10397.1 peptidase S9 [Pseudoalteromonas luteoviolacea]AOT15533.1 peptidase S9 [Pseudoalteromonas luteoviolacea]AOT20216.1 peptidase S9 [Pseudoalteromonas luteoviolacea]KKE82161.1 hypothetical protein N479_19350 [Pseudoalteromonas luteoviolacea S4054]KZN69683.1 hypothetical protein N481_21785 [Pseudoalteromonas luteoviolacea S4047-1]
MENQIMNKNLSAFKSVVISAAIGSSILLTGCQFTNTLDSAKAIQTQQVTELVELESLFSQDQINKVSLSNDGKWVAFMQMNNGGQNIFVLRQGEQLENAVALTDFSDGVDGFVWSANSNEILFNKDFEGNENDQIFTLRFSPKQTKLAPVIKRLTHRDDVDYMLVEQVKNDSNKIAVLANHNSSQLDLFHIDINTQAITLMQDNDISFFTAQLDDDGYAAVAAKLNSDNSVTVYKRFGDGWKEVFQSEVGENVSVISYDSDSNKAFISGSIQGRDKEELLELDLTTHKLKTAHKDPENQSDLYQVIFDKVGKPMIVSYYGGRLRNYTLSNSTATTMRKIEAQLSGDYDLLVEKIEHDKGQWYLKVSYADRPDEKFVYNTNSGTLTDLLNQAPSFNPDLLGDRSSITYTAADGVQIQAYLTLPKQIKQNLPTIILPHGGPWARDEWGYSSNYFVPVAHFFANRGYAVLQPNFRSSTGFGKQFIELGNKNWGTGTMQQDLTDGVNYLVEMGIADKQRVGIMGASYGGYAALAGATFTPDVYSAVISYVGPSSLTAMVESFPAHFRPYMGTVFAGVGDPLIEEDRVDMESRSPINYVDKIKTPIMLIQGANDPRIPQYQSDTIAKKLFETDRAVEYILAKDEGHGFRSQDNKLASIIAMEAFFAKHLGGMQSSKVNPKIKDHLTSLTVDVSKL